MVETSIQLFESRINHETMLPELSVLPVLSDHSRDPAEPNGKPASDTPPLTRVELTWIAKEIECWIRFGRHCHELRIDRIRRVLSYEPGRIFALVRWQSNAYGTVLSRIDILRAVHAGEAYQSVPLVDPGAQILLTITGWAKVQLVLNHIDRIEARGINCEEVAPNHWHHVHNRLRTGGLISPYTIERHQAWLKRREAGQ